MLHMFSLLKLLYNWTPLKNKNCTELLKFVKLLKKEQFVLLYYHLLPVEVVTIYTQVMLHWMDSPPEHSSSNCASPRDFHILGLLRWLFWILSPSLVKVSQVSFKNPGNISWVLLVTSLICIPSLRSRVLVNVLGLGLIFFGYARSFFHKTQTKHFFKN